MQGTSILSSGISFLVTPKTRAPKEFIEWLRQQVNERYRSLREASAAIGISLPTISDILTNGNQPSFKTVQKIASTFRVSETYLLTIAGLMKPSAEDDPLQDEWDHIFHSAPPEERDALIERARFELEQIQKRKRK